MKKITALLAVMITFALQNVQAQCGTPVLDSVCYTSLISAGGGICKDSLPQGMVGHPYSADVSFVMPPSVHITSPITATVTLININITGIGALPLGLDYACSKPSCVYHPSAGDALGALRVCGTPLAAGFYTLTVFILADVNVSGVGDRYGEAQTYTTTVRILPDTSGGAATFNYTPGGSSFCDTTDLTFHASLTSATNPVKYAWNFGNGNTSNLLNPAVQTYLPSTTPYQVSLTSTLYAYRMTRVKIVSTNSSAWSGDAGELTSLQSPDFVFKNTSTNRATAEASNQKTPDWTGLRDTIPPGTDSVGFTLTDIDGSFFGLDPDDLCITGKLPVTLGTVNYISGSNSLFVVFDTIPYQIFNDTVSIHVNALPAPGILTITSDSICNGDSALITVNYGAGYTFQWQQDGVDIPLANDSFYIAKTAGTYSVNIADATSGCSTTSDRKSLYTFNNVTSVTIAVVAPGQLANTNYPGPGFVVEWYKNGQLIVGEHGVILHHTGDGAYTCHIYNPAYPRCGATSGAIVISGVNDISETASMLSITPNPSAGIFTLNFNVNKQTDYELNILDVVGKTVHSEQLNNFNGEFKKEFDFSNLDKGMYFVRLVSKESSVSSKIIIQ